MTRPSPQQILEWAVAGNGPRVGSAVVAIVTVESTVNLRWAGNTLTTNGTASTTSTTVVAIEPVSGGLGFGTQSGIVHSRSDLDSLLSAAQSIATSSAPAEDAMDLPPVSSCVDWSAAPVKADPIEFAAITSKLGEIFRRGAASGVDYYGYAEFSVATTYLATTTGTRLRDAIPSARFEMTAKSHDRGRSTWVGQAGRNFQEIDVTAAETECLKQLQWQLRTIALKPGRHPTILSTSATADLFVNLLWSAGARDAIDGSSVFASAGGGTRLGEQLTSRLVTLASDPFDPALGCTPFVVSGASSPLSSVFDNGLPLERTEWLSEGYLKALLSTRYTAKLGGIATTPFIDNVTLSDAAGHGTLSDLISRTENAILLNCLWYIRDVDPQQLLLTGLTRDGAYQVRDGEVVGSVGNFRFNDSPVSLLARITDATEPTLTLPRELGDYFPRVRTPALSVSEFNFSTPSQAN